MFVTELFKSNANRIVLTNLPKESHRATGLIYRLAKFHNINLEYDNGQWIADDTAGVNPFLKDVTYLLSAAGIATNMQEDDSNTDEQRKLVAIFRKGPTIANPKAPASKIYLWKTGPGDNTYEMEVGQDRKRIPVTLSFAQIRATLAKKGFNESILKAGRLLIEASMTKSIPSKKESVFHKGVEKLLGQQVAVIVVDHPDKVAYGVFKRIGETGLCHIKLNGGKLPGWAAGDMIAVRPSEVYAPWDSRLQGMTAVHREYGERGEKTVREADDSEAERIGREATNARISKMSQAEKVNKGWASPTTLDSDLDKQIEFHQLGLANAQYKGPMATMHRKKLRQLFALQKKLDGLIDSGEGYTGGTQEERDKRFDKFVGEDSKWSKLPSGDYRNTDTGRAYSKKGGGPDNGGNSSYMTPEYMLACYKKRLAQIEAGPYKRSKEVAQLQRKIAKLSGQRSYMLHRDGTETPVREDDEGENYYETEIRKALANGDDYTAKAFAKMAATPEERKRLMKIIRQDMYAPELAKTDTDDGRNYSGMVGNNRWNEGKIN